MPGLIERYVLTTWLKAFALSVLAMWGILLIEDMSDDLLDLVNWGASVTEVVQYYLILSPAKLPTLIPVALLLSLLFALGGMHRHNEITALRGAGLGLWQITRTLWLGALLIAAGLFFLQGTVIPAAVEEARAIQQELSHRHALAEASAEEVGVIQNMAYHNHAEGRVWFLNRFSTYHFRAFGLMISILDEEGREVRRIRASEGYFDDLSGQWVLMKGRDQLFQVSTGSLMRSVPFAERHFAELTEDPHLMQLRQRRTKDLSWHELQSLREEIDQEADPKAIEYEQRSWSILFNPLVCLLVVGLALPFALGGVRVNPLIGVFKSLGLFFLYFAAAQTASLAALGEWISPVMAAALPLAGGLLLCLLLAWRVR